MDGKQNINLTSDAQGRISIHNLTEHQVGVLIDRALLGARADSPEQNERLDLRTAVREAWIGLFGPRVPVSPPSWPCGE